VFILFVLNNFIKNPSITKSRDLIADLFRGHASSPYNKTGTHLLFVVLNVKQPTKGGCTNQHVFHNGLTWVFMTSVV